MTKMLEEERDEYIATYHREVGTASARMNALAGLSLVEDLAATVMFAAERGHLTIPPGAPGATLNRLVLKLSHELLGFVGCMKAGSLTGAYHHIRAVIELAAAQHYLFSKKVEQRCTRFMTWPVVEEEKHLRRLKDQLAKGTITQTYFDDMLKARAPRAPVVDDQVLESWEKLYECPTIRSEGKLPDTWHHGRPITVLIQALDISKSKGGNNQTAAEGMYTIACHATHVSPIAHRLAGHGSLRLIGWTELEGTSAVVFMMVFAIELVQALDKVLGGKLWPLAEPVARLWLAQRPQGTPGPTTGHGGTER